MFARNGGPDAAGLYALSLAVCAPIFVLANLQLRELQATDVQKEFWFHERLAVRIMALVAALAALLVTALIVAKRNEALHAILVMGVAKSVESLADLGYGALQTRERFVSIAIVQVVRGIIGLAAATTVFIVSGSVAMALLALATGWLVTVLALDLPRVVAVIAPDPILPVITVTRLRRLVQQALPMGVVAGIGAITLTLPSYTIQHVLGTNALGHFTAVLYLLFPGTVAIIALGQSANPRLARKLAAGDQTGFLRLVFRLSLVALGLGLSGLAVTWLVGEMILGLVYGEAWKAHAPVFFWLACAAMVQWVASILGFATTTARRLLVQVPIGLLACAISGLSSWYLIPRAGLAGAAWSMALTFVVLVGCHAVVLVISLRSPRTN